MISGAVTDMQEQPRTVAAIDLGSNSFHLLVARQRGNDIHVIDRLRDAVRLGAGFDASGDLDGAAMERALFVLEKFGQRIRGLPKDNVRAVGTNALRKARNADEFLRLAKRALGYSIDVVSGIEEARLIYGGVAHSLAVDEQRRFVVDIGGGSTELIIGCGTEPELLESLQMGCVSMTERFFREGRVSRKNMRAAQLFARQQLEVVEASFRRHGWNRAIGASGTLRVLDQLCRERTGARGITPDGLRRIEQDLCTLGDVRNFQQLGVNPDRCAVLAGGLCVLLGVVDALAIEHIEVADGALREGLLLDLIGRLENRDARARTVATFIDRYRIDAEHGARVAATARRLFDVCRDSWNLGGEENARMLGWAAQLCEIGLGISHSGFHKHGAYILSNADLAGFSRQEQRLLAALVRAHRRKFPRQDFTQLPEPWDETGPRLAFLLRLAVLLNRARSDGPLPAIDAECTASRIRLKFPPGWLESHPLTRADLEEEAELLAAEIGIDCS